MSSTAKFSLDPPEWNRSAADELVNAATHAFGLVLAVVGGLVMAGAAAAKGDAWSIVACGIYLACLIAVYAMSTLSHSAQSPRWKLLFRRLDQGAIYLLIAATYTPFSMLFLRNGLWWMLLAVIWAIALGGFVSKVFFAHRVNAVSLAPYVLLGWLPIISVPALSQYLSLDVFWAMLIGGLCYTIGTLFLVHDTQVRHFHALWHLSVIAGSACHFCGIMLALSLAGG